MHFYSGGHQPAGRDLIPDMQVSRKCLLIFLFSFNFGAATIHQGRNPNKSLNSSEPTPQFRNWMYIIGRRQRWGFDSSFDGLDKHQQSTSIKEDRQMNLPCRCLHHIDILWNAMMNNNVHYGPGQNDSQHHGTGPCMASGGSDIKYSAAFCGYIVTPTGNSCQTSSGLVWTKMFFHVHHSSPPSKLRPSNSWQRRFTWKNYLPRQCKSRDTKGWMTTILAKSIWSPNKPQRHRRKSG